MTKFSPFKGEQAHLPLARWKFTYLKLQGESMPQRVFTFLLFSFIVAFSVFPKIFAQTVKPEDVAHLVHKIKSETLAEERTVLVRLPDTYMQSNQKYPVIYMLDGHAPHPAMMAGIVQQQASSAQMPEMIIVSVQNINRMRDMTPTHVDKYPASGGGDKFLRFIETEVIPLVEKNYRTASFRIFAGHSLSGLMVLYSLASHSELFNVYIAASPSLHWDKDFIIKQFEESFQRKKEWKKTLFVALGDEPSYQKRFTSFQDLVKTFNPTGLEYEFRFLSEEDHMSVILQAYYWGLRKAFAAWSPSAAAKNSVADLERHYKKLSEKYNFQVVIPEIYLNQIGYDLFYAKKYSEAIEVFKKFVEHHPNSAYAHSSLAESFLASGEKELALEFYKKALKLDAKDKKAADAIKKLKKGMSSQ